MTRSLDAPAQSSSSNEFDAQLAEKFWEGGYSHSPAIGNRKQDEATAKPASTITTEASIASNQTRLSLQIAQLDDRSNKAGAAPDQPSDSPPAKPTPAGADRPGSDRQIERGPSQPSDSSNHNPGPEQPQPELSKELDRAATVVVDLLKMTGEMDQTVGAILGRELEDAYDKGGDKGIQDLINSINQKLAPEYNLEISEDPAITKQAAEMEQKHGMNALEYVRMLTVRDADGKPHGRMMFAVSKKEKAPQSI